MNRSTSAVHYGINFDYLQQIAVFQANAKNKNTPVHVGYICKVDNRPIFAQIGNAYKYAETGEIFHIVVHLHDSDAPDIVEVRNQDLFVRTVLETHKFPSPHKPTKIKPVIARKDYEKLHTNLPSPNQNNIDG